MDTAPLVKGYSQGTQIRGRLIQNDGLTLAVVFTGQLDELYIFIMTPFVENLCKLGSQYFSIAQNVNESPFIAIKC